MPTSFPTFDAEIERWLAEHPYAEYLDVGCGDGKYGILVHRLVPGARVTGIEIDPAWVESYKLAEHYDELYCMDATDWVDHEPDFVTDVAILGDVIEHLRKSDGLDLLHFLVYRCKWLILTFPSRYKQGAWYGHVHEAHRSVWDARDFAQFEHEYLSRDHGGQVDNLVIVRGYR